LFDESRKGLEQLALHEITGAAHDYKDMWFHLQF
jgi:hypothetical protein